MLSEWSLLAPEICRDVVCRIMKVILNVGIPWIIFSTFLNLLYPHSPFILFNDYLSWTSFGYSFPQYFFTISLFFPTKEEFILYSANISSSFLYPAHGEWVDTWWLSVAPRLAQFLSQGKGLPSTWEWLYLIQYNHLLMLLKIFIWPLQKLHPFYKIQIVFFQ